MRGAARPTEASDRQIMLCDVYLSDCEVQWLWSTQKKAHCADPKLQLGPEKLPMIDDMCLVEK